MEVYFVIGVFFLLLIGIGIWSGKNFKSLNSAIAKEGEKRDKALSNVNTQFDELRSEKEELKSTLESMSSSMAVICDQIRKHEESNTKDLDKLEGLLDAKLKPIQKQSEANSSALQSLLLKFVTPNE